jgi:Excalibur calcium-binding domain
MSGSLSRAALLLALIAAALLGWALIATSPSGGPLATPDAGASSISKGDPKDCDDFRTQKKAQKWFKNHNPRRDPAGLDADNDRIACEDNRCPCSRKWHRQHGREFVAVRLSHED